MVSPEEAREYIHKNRVRKQIYRGAAALSFGTKSALRYARFGNPTPEGFANLGIDLTFDFLDKKSKAGFYSHLDNTYTNERLEGKSRTRAAVGVVKEGIYVKARGKIAGKVANKITSKIFPKASDYVTKKVFTRFPNANPLAVQLGVLASHVGTHYIISNKVSRGIDKTRNYIRKRKYGGTKKQPK